MADKRQLLKRYWHYTAFRPCQEEIIDSLLQGRDVFVLMPTGGGKSLCYQLPPLMMEGLCLVVTPLVALMKDQVETLNRRRLSAACLYAGVSSTETMNVLNNAVSGRLKFLYVSPERLQLRSFIDNFRRMNVCLIAVDEAHCVSQWGYDFRPPYLKIADIRQYHPSVPMVALTATATPAVVEDICRHLQLRSPLLFRTGFDRPNLSYIVSRSSDKMSRLLRVCRSIAEGSGIVYAGTRRHTEAFAAFLVANDVPALFYHAGLSIAERDRRQAAWMTGGCRVIVATNAFGMGIDKDDVRFVVHMDTPASLEAYYQEAGRAGRDGKPAIALLICDDNDPTALVSTFAADYPPPSHIRNVYNALCNFYRIPMGSGQDTSVEYQPEAICSTYCFPPREFYVSCRFLERLSLINIVDGGIPHSLLYVPLGRDELYRFQVENMRMGDLLVTASRMYPGIFNERTVIDERRLASHSMIDAAEVRRLLRKMNDMRVVEYTPRTDKPQLVFVSERIDAHSIALDPTCYDMQKSAARARLDAVLAYIANDTVCRSRQLRAYFGETEGVDDCGHCDVCTRRRQTEQHVEQAIRQAVAQGRHTVSSLCEVLGEQNYVGVDAVVKRMLDSGDLQVDKNLFLSLS